MLTRKECKLVCGALQRQHSLSAARVRLAVTLMLSLLIRPASIVKLRIKDFMVDTSEDIMCLKVKVVWLKNRGGKRNGGVARVRLRRLYARAVDIELCPVNALATYLLLLATSSCAL